MTGCEIDWARVASVLKALGPIGSWILIIIGWKVVSRDHNQREDRKDVRALINNLGTLVRAIEEKAHRYYLQGGATAGAQTLSMEIRRDFKRLAGDLGRLKKLCGSVDFKFDLIAFRQAVSGGDFDVKKRSACTPDSTKLSDVSSAADSLLSILEDGFTERFKIK
jgi:hypothetical protein